MATLIQNPNIGLRPHRRRGAHGVLASFQLPLRGNLRDQRGRRRRRAQMGLPAPLPLRLPARARLGVFTRVYLLIALIVGGLVLYLYQAAGVTQTSYQIGQLQARHQDLAATQGQLRYQEANRQAPAQVQADATATGMVRPLPHKYVDSQTADLGLGSPPPHPPDQSPLYAQVMRSLDRQLGGERDAFAAGR